MTTSVLVCTYNRGNLINETLKCLIGNQTNCPDEIIIINGGGDNDCLDVSGAKVNGNLINGINIKDKGISFGENANGVISNLDFTFCQGV